MKNKKTIFEVLFEKEICFAVIVSLNTFNGEGIDENSRDYSLIVQKQDLKELKNMNFKKTDDYVNVYERDLSVSEIAEFKTYMDKFVKVQHNKFGRVYELKNNSFQKLYESIEQSLTIPVVSGNYYWVKLMTDDKHEPAMAINLLGVMNFKFFNGVAVPCDKVNDYSECNYC